MRDPDDADAVIDDLFDVDPNAPAPRAEGNGADGEAGQGAAAPAAPKKRRTPARKGGGKGRAKLPKPDDPKWSRWALLILLAVCAARVAVNALPLIPIHFDEAQYWVYGTNFDFGYFSKPPLAAWMIRLSTEIFGDTAFGVRFFAPFCHLAIGALILAIGARLFDRRTGFWAAMFYTAGPGVVLSSMLMTTDPPMMIGWAIGIYAYLRAIEPVRIGRRKPQPAPLRPLWWALAGLGIGLGMMAKYTAGVALIGILGHLRFSAEPGPERARAGVALMALTTVLALSPNLVWNAMNGFVTVAHLGDNADFGGGGGASLRPEKLAEFIGAQFGVIGPAAAAAIFAGLGLMAWKRAWRSAPGMAFLGWFTAPLLLAIAIQALREGANPNWAAPAFVSGSVLAAHVLSADRWRWARLVQVWAGAVSAVFLVVMAVLYGVAGQDLPRTFDPYKKMRGGAELCEIALGALETEGADALLMDNRRRLSDCMYMGDLRLGDVAFLDMDGRIDNHYDLTVKLKPGDERVFVYITQSAELGEAVAADFDDALMVGEGEIATHGDSVFPWVMWRLEGYRGE
ncbi:ArnT family glycosyltransferase [Rhodovulum sp. DZ06]|uniref:ArnT family glycosyltransferase n=1 Tax=Rhodovulum sp. DZ06 TaxID=3425126 RepID=UPI003D33A323